MMKKNMKFNREYSVKELLMYYSWGSLCSMGLSVLSLLNCFAVCLLAGNSGIGGIDASISRAWMGVVQNAAQMSQITLFCTLLIAWACCFLPVHQTTNAYEITGRMQVWYSWRRWGDLTSKYLPCQESLSDTWHSFFYRCWRIARFRRRGEFAWRSQC